MDTNRLVKLYDVLKPAERVPLLLDADARGDQAEYDRLVRTAPRSTYTLPDFYPMMEGLYLIGYLHGMEMLQVAANLWPVAVSWRLRMERQDDNEKAYRAMRCLAYQFLILLDGWRQWGAKLQIDLEAQLKALPCYETLLSAESFAREAACTEAEATAYQGGKPAPTAASVAADLQKTLDIWIRKRG